MDACDKVICLVICCIALAVSLAICFGISRGRASDALEAEKQIECIKIHQPSECVLLKVI